MKIIPSIIQVGELPFLLYYKIKFLVLLRVQGVELDEI